MAVRFIPIVEGLTVSEIISSEATEKACTPIWDAGFFRNKIARCKGRTAVRPYDMDIIAS